jgi:outer membrane protein, multidrug efflux system
MKCRALVLVLAFAGAACTAGPRYNPDAVIAPQQRIGTSRLSDSSRRFFDSLAVERQRDSVRVVSAPSARATLSDASVNSVAWMDIIRDSTLVALVETALRQNRNLQVAVARINEYRADVGIARAPLVPSLAINGSEGSNQVALGAFPPTSFRATRFTGDLAWELDFWGRVRRGVEAANADLGAQEASQRATTLSLVSDVASGYLQLLELDQERAIAERTLSSRKATLDIARQRFAQGLTSELDVHQFEAQVAAPAVTLAQTRSRCLTPSRYPSSRGGPTSFRPSARTRRRWRGSVSPTRRGGRRSTWLDHMEVRLACRTICSALRPTSTKR